MLPQLFCLDRRWPWPVAAAAAATAAAAACPGSINPKKEKPHSQTASHNTVHEPHNHSHNHRPLSVGREWEQSQAQAAPSLGVTARPTITGRVTVQSLTQQLHSAVGTPRHQDLRVTCLRRFDFSMLVLSLICVCFVAAHNGRNSHRFPNGWQPGCLVARGSGILLGGRQATGRRSGQAPS